MTDYEAMRVEAAAQEIYYTRGDGTIYEDQDDECKSYYLELSKAALRAADSVPVPEVMSAEALFNALDVVGFEEADFGIEIIRRRDSQIWKAASQAYQRPIEKCAFCGENGNPYLVAGAGLFICNDCIGIGKDYIETEINRRAASQGKGDGWQTIESAPKDGTEILVGDYEDGEFVQGVSWWTRTYGFSGNRVHNPLYWQPLPAAPNQTQDKE